MDHLRFINITKTADFLIPPKSNLTVECSRQVLIERHIKDLIEDCHSEFHKEHKEEILGINVSHSMIKLTRKYLTISVTVVFKVEETKKV